MTADWHDNANNGSENTLCKEETMKIRKNVMAVTVAVVLCSAAFNAVAAEEVKRGKMTVQSSDSIADIIGKYTGKYVTLRLASNGDVAGRVALVTNKLVYLTEIQGKEYFDIVIQLDRIEAVEVRVLEN